jgi:hypothetical protein
MAKRVRGGSTRPGQRRRLQRSTAPRTSAAPPTSAPSTSLTASEEARAAELEAQILAAEQEADVTASRSRDRGRRAAEPEVRTRPGSIAVRAGQEYAYVMRDVRRIAIIGGSLIVFLLLLWFVTQATGVGPF